MTNIYKATILWTVFIFHFFTVSIIAQPAGTITDEKNVPPYTLPDPLILSNGKPVKDAKTWYEQRKPELLSMFETQMYGKTPSTELPISFQITSENHLALGGKATRKEVTVYFTSDKKGPSMVLLIYLPNRASGPVPAFLGLNFDGNHTVLSDTGISLTKSWVENNDKYHIADHKANAERRGSATSQWAVEKILDRGYGFATVYYGDIDPDFNDGFQNGIHPLFYSPGQTRPKSDEWGSIGAWAWGLSRALDILGKDKAIDSKRVIVMGHSRLGKAALWAGVQDQRFAIVISNNSGCGGAALSKRIFGETVKTINDHFPHWFCDNFKKYNGNESALPFDQHALLALIAPRPVYVASSQEDLWADPLGEFLSAYYASPVYQLLGTDGLAAEKQPEVNHPVMSRIGYHLRTGKHDVTSYDWDMYLNFADKYLGKF